MDTGWGIFIILMYSFKRKGFPFAEMKWGFYQGPLDLLYKTSDFQHATSFSLVRKVWGFREWNLEFFLPLFL